MDLILAPLPATLLPLILGPFEPTRAATASGGLLNIEPTEDDLLLGFDHVSGSIRLLDFQELGCWVLPQFSVLYPRIVSLLIP